MATLQQTRYKIELMVHPDIADREKFPSDYKDGTFINREMRKMAGTIIKAREMSSARREGYKYDTSSYSWHEDWVVEPNDLYKATEL